MIALPGAYTVHEMQIEVFVSGKFIDESYLTRLFEKNVREQGYEPVSAPEVHWDQPDLASGYWRARIAGKAAKEETDGRYANLLPPTGVNEHTR